MDRLPVWATSIQADSLYALRRLKQTKMTSAAAIVSLALALGASTTAFRLIDGLLLRPMAIAHPERLYAVAFRGANVLDGRLFTSDSSSHPAFEEMRAVVHPRARLMAASYVDRTDVTYGSDDEMEKAFTQFVSGDMFTIFGLAPAAGRLFTASDDVTPGGHPVAVISYDYWIARFGRDPKIVGRTLRIGNDPYQIIGVSAAGFSGTETGMPVDVFLPMMMKTASTLMSPNNFWLRILAELDPQVSAAAVREQLASVFQAIEAERSKSVTLRPIQKKELFSQTLLLEPAGSGRSNLQRDYRDALYALAALVTLVLLIACANVANLMMGRAMARSREMAVRVWLGAGRARLLQLVLIESAWIAALATLAGVMLSSWSTPFVIEKINSPENPIRLRAPFDLRMAAFSVCLSFVLTILFGLLPALRSSSLKPSAGLKGASDPHQRRRLMHTMTMAQAAFCPLVLLLAGMFVRSFEQLSRQPLGYSPDRIVNLESVARHAQPAIFWEQAADSLRSVPGVEAVTLAAWPFMSGETANSAISTHGVASDVFADRFLVSPGWFSEMKIPMPVGRDFRSGEARPGPAIVNESFAKQFFDAEDAIAKSFDTLDGRGGATRLQVVAVVADARYRDNLRIPIRPTFFMPFRAVATDGSAQPIGRGTFVVRTAAGIETASLGSALRKAVSLAQPGIRVSNVRSQREIVESKAVRERLLSLLAGFFAAVAMVLAAVGLYGVLDYSVLQQRREVGIRIAIGARRRDVVKQVALATITMIGVGTLLGLFAGLGSIRYIGSMLFHVRALDAAVILPAVLTIVFASAAAAVFPILRALRIDPVELLKS
jgi:putative ABC transport system permease protein